MSLKEWFKQRNIPKTNDKTGIDYSTAYKDGESKLNKENAETEEKIKEKLYPKK
jgi:hypothetical protein